MARSTTTSKTTSTRSKTTAAKKTTTKAAPKTAAAKASTTATAIKPAPAAASPELTVVGDVTPKVSPGMMKKRELMKAVIARSGARQKLAKPVVEAALEILGEALAEGRELNLPPMGKVKIQRTKTVAGGTVSVMKLRRTDAMLANAAANADDDDAASDSAAEKDAIEGKEPLADGEE